MSTVLDAIDLARSLTDHQAAWAVLALAAAGWFLREVTGGRRRRRPRRHRPLPAGQLDPRRNFSAAQRAWIYRHYRGRCRYCGVALHFAAKCKWLDGCRDCFHADHIHPHSRQGRTCLSNGQATCRYHNQEKGDMTHEEYMASKGVAA